MLVLDQALRLALMLKNTLTSWLGIKRLEKEED